MANQDSKPPDEHNKLKLIAAILGLATAILGFAAAVLQFGTFKLPDIFPSHQPKQETHSLISTATVSAQPEAGQIFVHLQLENKKNVPVVVFGHADTWGTMLDETGKNVYINGHTTAPFPVGTYSGGAGDLAKHAEAGIRLDPGEKTTFKYDQQIRKPWTKAELLTFSTKLWVLTTDKSAPDGYTAGQEAVSLEKLPIK